MATSIRDLKSEILEQADSEIVYYDTQNLLAHTSKECRSAFVRMEAITERLFDPSDN